LTDISIALKTKGHEFSADDIFELNLTFDKIRWEFDFEENKMRATHGHSFPVLLDEKIKIPPEVLYHGAPVSSIENILKNGLKSMSRQYVHLTTNIETAIETATRYGKPIIVEIDAKLLHQEGSVFFQTSDNVWLTKDITPAYLSFNPWHTVSSDEKKQLSKELIKEISLNHELNDVKNHPELIMRRYDRDDCLFIDSNSGKVYSVHLTWAHESNPAFPGTETYESLNDWITNRMTVDQSEWYTF
jgi:RNA:NAD 2'-phosphotransferase (TPT1/KptA family)